MSTITEQTKQRSLRDEYASHPVAITILPLKTKAMERAEAAGREQLAKALKILADAGWNLDAVAPAPSATRDGAREYRRKKAKRNFFASFTMPDQEARRMIATAQGVSEYSPGLAMIIKEDPASQARYLESCKSEAAAQYELFVWKLCGKVGACDSAVLDGEHVWGHSILTVQKGSNVEHWKTQTIINYSVYGKPFNQWPSRKVKIKGRR